MGDGTYDLAKVTPGNFAGTDKTKEPLKCSSERFRGFGIICLQLFCRVGGDP